MRVFCQNLVNRCPKVPRRVIDDDPYLTTTMTWIHSGDVFEMSNEGLLKDQIFRLPLRAFVLGRVVHETGTDAPIDKVDGAKAVDSAFVVPGTNNWTVSFEPECRPKSGHKGETGLILTEKNYLTCRCSFFSSSISRFATACFSGFARRKR